MSLQELEAAVEQPPQEGLAGSRVGMRRFEATPDDFDDPLLEEILRLFEGEEHECSRD